MLPVYEVGIELQDDTDKPLSDEEMQRRLERALKRSVNTPPKPITKKESGKSALKGRKIKPKNSR